MSADSATTTLPSELEEFIASLLSVTPVDQPFSAQHNNWSYPSVTRAELAESFSLLNDRVLIEIKSVQPESVEATATQLNLLATRVGWTRQNVLPQLPGNPPVGVAVILSLLEAIRSQVDRLEFTRTSKLPKPEDLSNDVAAAKKMRTALRAGENLLKELQPRLNGLNVGVDYIIAAQSAMAQLPEDLASLNEKRERVESTAGEILKMQGTAKNAVSDLMEKIKDLAELHERAEKTLDRADEAYRANTSQGLASAFKDRADSLTQSVWVWVFGLIGALAGGGFVGYLQLDRLTAMIDKAAASQGQSSTAIWVDFVLSILSIGGPFWFAWLATKQIGQRFKLAEDYAYKASISKAYEGYRQEAVRLDPTFQSRLFSSALTRLEEIPLRVMDETNHGSPWHALLDSDVIRQAVNTVPQFADRVIQLAKDALPDAKEVVKNEVEAAGEKAKRIIDEVRTSTEAEKQPQ
ncbi:hypothetical protein [Silvimonas iriomotensis]|uniref:Uncharacterized protein n=1 Tax=Silvimonas iriomotensis TaxID=449662 RepID=A0ABQ2P595_9NEIS|nr:hypothetical protein [Silvimonas iriomotensis]GGP18142.1 hypothetical protein GCM10010970_03390 [Silvimonas iriomotensis]